ncbi:hypothetical protein B7R87_29515 [Streptomyces tsukubensis]|uniref:Uncharacterized protein n=1 Tax=Streptomyces tsukubensis (strain DSM 42081 / NBRC 108919 / NRRL 18488 / 9993) TaxID=1114943 RepID=I2N9N4_STRT9|nr:hypothetical protein B7R87_29515 [Streptomyces tsukubensis]EIF93731.1 hypothetical protein [Streptomyces tsukubensis NRRL18488]QKM66491.1 hypothetical protein STSU_004265 [Streptomyces tsukubensis NRRL18488]
MALAALLALTSVACDEGLHSASVDARGLGGDWANEAGTRFVFRADGRTDGTGLRHSLPGDSGCPDAWSGTWQFLGVSGEADTEPAENPDGTLARGDSIDLMADAAEADGCSVLIQVGRDGRGLALCLVEDPGIDCTDRELLRGPDRTGPESPLVKR